MNPDDDPRHISDLDPEGFAKLISQKSYGALKIIVAAWLADYFNIDNLTEESLGDFIRENQEKFNTVFINVANNIVQMIYKETMGKDFVRTP